MQAKIISRHGIRNEDTFSVRYRTQVEVHYL